jgi:hypothetical protein
MPTPAMRMKSGTNVVMAVISLIALPLSVLMLSATGLAQIVPTDERTSWLVTSKVNEMTSKTEYTFHTTAVSEAKADFQLMCFDNAWQETKIILDIPVPRHPDFLIWVMVRLDEAVPYRATFGVLPDSKTLIVLGGDDNEPRRMVRASKIAIQCTNAEGMATLIVFRPPSFDPSVSRYCGANPQDELPLRLEVRYSGKASYKGSADWVLYEVDGKERQTTYVNFLPLSVAASSTIRISVDDKNTMKGLYFKLNGQAVQPVWRAVKDRYSKFTATFQKP